MANKYPSESELIVVAKPEAALRAAAPGTHMESVARTDVTPLNRILKTHAATIRPLFGASEDRLILERLEAAPDGPPIPNLSVYYRVKAPEQQLRAIAKELREHEAVEAAYVKPPAQPPLNEMAPAAVNAPQRRRTSPAVRSTSTPRPAESMRVTPGCSAVGVARECASSISKGRGASATKILRKTRVAWLVARQARILAGETTGRPSSENSVATLTASA